MDFGIKGKRALVCASSKGLGRGCAEALAGEGVNLVINSRTAEVLEQTAQEIRDQYGVEVIAVAADSDVNTLPELLDMVKNDPTSVSVAGGSAVGGWDHLKVLIAANAYGIEDVRSVKYIAFDGGGEAVTQLLAGSVQAFTGDISEAKGFVDSGDIKVIAVLSPERLEGEFADFPTAKEQGIDAIGANWRGFYAPGGMSDEAYDAWVSKIADLYASDEWKEIMAANGLAPLSLQGAEFQEFVANSVQQIQDISKEIGIIK